MRRVFPALAIAALVVSPAAGQQPAVDRLLRQAGAYVGAFEQQITAIVSEETYLQDSIDRARNQTGHRELKSDFSLVRGDRGVYVEFRDVFSVDGRAVRDRQDRLTRLFLNPSASSSGQLRAIVEESARYNIGGIERTLNTPMLALLFLRTENQHASVFAPAGSANPELETQASSAGRPGASVLAFEEGGRNTLIRGKAGRDLPARGRFWIDGTTGRILMSELVADDSDSGIRAVVDVTYQPEAELGVMLPAEMKEKYTRGGTTVTGRATYGRFRRFSVSTEEDLKQPARR